MSIPKNPRQQMINLMYLVLTALLALNVSAEILSAFSTVNNSLNDSNAALTQRNNQIYAAFAREVSNGRHGAEELQAKALKAKNISASFLTKIEALKSEITDRSGGMEEGKLIKPGNTSVPTRLMIKEARGLELWQQIQAYRDSFLLGIDPDLALELESSIPLGSEILGSTTEQSAEEWNREMFYNMPSVSALTHLCKIQSDIQSTESQIIQRFFDEMGGDLIEVDTFVALVNASSSYIMDGENYSSEILLAAASKSVPMEVWVGGQKLTVEGAKAKFSRTASGTGEKSYQGKIRYFNPKTGDWSEVPFKQNYMVAKPSASISPSSMNLFYMGVDNSIDVAVAGVDQSNVSFKVTGNVGQVVTPKGVGKYNVKVTRPGLAKAIATVTYPSGRTQNFEVDFKAKPLPNPNLSYQGKGGGTIPRALFINGTNLKASLNNFPVNVPYRVKSFSLMRSRGGQIQSGEKQSGSKISQRNLNLIKTAKRGDKFYFEDIVIAIPDGRTYDGNILLKIR